MDEQRKAELTTFLVNRVVKNHKKLKKWVRKNEIECYRIYDKDIPEIALSLDLYGDSLYAAFYRSSVQSDEEVDQLGKHFVAAVANALEIDADAVFIKFRERQRGLQQYQKLSDEQRKMVVREGGFRFFVNLIDYLDTGLFLDHRVTRGMVQQESMDKRVLNLFAYTGSFSVYAAAGGARQVTTVDLSNTYIEWAKENFVLNNLEGLQYEFVRDDVTHFLKEAAENKKCYDIIVLDPPTFSNSKRMHDSFDVQRDYVALVHRCLRVLDTGGIIYFSTNYRKFRPDFSQFSIEKVLEITNQTIPLDFRNKRIHRCWKIIK